MRDFFVSVFLLIGTLVSAQNYQNEAFSQGVFYNYGTSRFGGGLSFADFNQDGWDDLSFASDAAGNIRFFENKEGSFQAINFVLPAAPRNIKQILWVDVENDQDKDLLLTSDSFNNVIYVNDGQFNFTPQVLPNPDSMTASFTFGASFADFDRDGDLDLFICNYGSHSNQLFENNGGVFQDITNQYTFSLLSEPSYQAVFFDYNYDLNPDVFVANDKVVATNKLYEGDGLGGLLNVSGLTGMNLAFNAMCATVGDYDNDMDLDVYVTDTDSSYLMQNTGGYFSNLSDSVGVGHYRTSWGSNFLDYDNDGFLDLYVCSAFGPLRFANRLYRNLQNGHFAEAQNAGFINDSTLSFSSAVGDYDRDGYPDIAVHHMMPDPSMLWHSSGGSNNWVKFRLQGTMSNRDAVGCWLHAYANGQVYTRYTIAGEGYLAQNSQDVLFGLAQASHLDSLQVNWISGLSETYYNLPANEHYWILEGNGICEAGEPDPTLEGLTFCTGDSPLWQSNGADSLPWPKGLRLTNTLGEQFDLSINTSTDFADFLDSLPAGNYQAHALAFHEQAAVCDISNSSVNISIGTDFSWQSEISLTSPPSHNDGEIAVLLSGQTGVGYFYQWSLDSTINTSTVTDLAPGMYYLTITDGYSCSKTDSFYVQASRPIPESHGFENIAPVITSMEEVEATDLKVFPNPVKEVMYINLPSFHEPTQLYIWSFYGKLWMKTTVQDKTGKIQLNISDFPSGNYYLYLQNKGFEGGVQIVIK